MTQQKIKFDYLVNEFRKVNNTTPQRRSSIAKMLQNLIDRTTLDELRTFMDAHGIELEIKSSMVATLYVLTDQANHMAFFPLFNPLLSVLIKHKCPTKQVEQCIDHAKCKELGSCLRCD